MRLIKMFGLAALAALASMAFVGATSASAEEPTMLCNAQHEVELICPTNQKTELFHVEDDGSNLLLTEILNVLCLHVLAELDALSLVNPPNAQEIHIHEIVFLDCGSNAAHTNCDVEVEAIPLFFLLKTDLNLGLIRAENGLVLVECIVGGIFKISCEYGPDPEFENPAEGAEHTEEAGNGMITLDDAPAVLEEGGFLCPEESTLDALLEPLDPLWIAS